jgi:mannose-6-phosphate isomerase-like protein (cupin superfamily)
MTFFRIGLLSSLLLTSVLSTRANAFVFPNVTPDSDAPSYLFLPDGPITQLKRGETTGGRYSLLESIVPPGGASPPHIHHEEDEWIYIEEGDMQIVVGERSYPDPAQIPGVNAPRDKLFAFDAPAGTLFLGNKNFIHGVRNTGETTAKVLLVSEPAGFENLIEVSQPVPDLSNLPEFDPETFGRVGAASPEFGLVGSISFEQFGDVVVDENFQIPDNQSDRLVKLLSDDSAASVPEPSLLVGMLLIGGVAVSTLLRRSEYKSLSETA